MRVVTPPVERVGSTKATLGESAFWHAERNAVLWVDIFGRRVFSTDAASGETKAFRFPDQTAFVQPARDGSWLVGQRDGILRLDPASGTSEPFAAVEADDPTTRTNDAACDRQGRLLVGTMRQVPDHELAPVGSLYRVAGDGRAMPLDSGLYIPNGIAFSPDGRTAYWADTFKTRRQIWQAPYDPSTGETGPKRPFVQLSEAMGRPDGATVDASGCYWVAAVWGWQLLRFTPSGELDLVVRLPVQRPTKLAFGGRDLRTIYVTSAAEGIEDPEAQPLAGHLLALDIGIDGLPPAIFDNGGGA